VLPCVRGLQNSSSLIKGASHRPKEGWVRVEKFRGPNGVYLGAQRPVSWHALACAAACAAQTRPTHYHKGRERDLT
jgi:hypothetical protein